ncbi:MAG: ATP-binding protein [Lachnospiraceae bacterium]|nr:ATP-binding protein [Lachnospiraceae bacterium]
MEQDFRKCEGKRMTEDKSDRAKKNRFIVFVGNHKEVFVNIVLLCVLACSITFLVLFNQRLRNSVQEERVEAVDQIGYLLTERISQLQDTYRAQVDAVVNVISKENREVNDNLSDYFEGPEEWLLLDQEGNFFTMSGDTAVMVEDSRITERILREEDTFSSFVSVQGRGDYWAFTHSLGNLEISGRTIIGLCRLVPTKTFADTTTVSLYNHLGSSYIVDREGVIVMHPDNVTSESLFQGYTVYSSLKNAGIEEEQYAELKTAISSNEEYQTTYVADNISWLVLAMPSTEEYELLVTVPTSITAEDTYAGLTYLMIAVAVVCMAGGIILFYNQYNLMRKGRDVQVQFVKAAAKSDFMNKMSHDIRTPLNAVVGLHELALESIDDKDMVYDCIIKAQASNKYLISLINAVLDMSRIEAGKMKINNDRIDLDEIVNHVMQMESQTALDASIKFTYEEKEKFSTDYMGDSVRIRQCLMNLVSNAIKFTPPDGTVLLSVGRTPLDDQIDQISFAVEDTGVGMSEEYIQHIFTPFEQEKNSMTNSAITGSGLGLSIVYNLVKMMGGTVTVTSKKNVGSRFEILLPLQRVEKEEKVQKEQEETVSEAVLKAALSGKHILLVEDHPINRQIITKLLEKMELIVDAAENGQIGVDKFCSSEVDYYSFILMDIKMPIMDGLEATKAIRYLDKADAQTIPIIALSANAFEEDMKASIEAGMQMHLAKPVDVVELKKVLMRVVKGENKS